MCHGEILVIFNARHWLTADSNVVCG